MMQSAILYKYTSLTLYKTQKSMTMDIVSLTTPLCSAIVKLLGRSNDRPFLREKGGFFLRGGAFADIMKQDPKGQRCL